MFLDKIFPHGKREKRVIHVIKGHIGLLHDACDLFRAAFEQDDRGGLTRILDIEREADSIRREIISNIYEGAFLPYFRSDICKFVEIVDSVFDLLEDTAIAYFDLKFPERIREDCARIAFLNTRISEMLLIAFEGMVAGEDLREKMLAIRIYEKKIDDMKFGLLKEIQEIPVENYWQGMTLSTFINGLTHISDIIEDAGDQIQIINVSLKT
jgi:hypothetical protein